MLALEVIVVIDQGVYSADHVFPRVFRSVALYCDIHSQPIIVHSGIYHKRGKIRQARIPPMKVLQKNFRSTLENRESLA